MESINTLTDYYYTELFPVIEKLELQREKIKKKFLFIVVLVISIDTIGVFYLLKKNSSMEPYLFGGFATLVGLSILFRFLTKEYTHTFKSSVIAPLINKIDPNLNYQENNTLPRSCLEEANIFQTTIDRYSGSDLVMGDVNTIPLKFSFIHAESKIKYQGKKESYQTLFSGLLIQSDFPKNFQGNTVVLPDIAQNILGDYLGELVQSFPANSRELIKMDNAQFEKEFVVYGTNQVEARYILTPAMMEKILTLKKRANAPIYLSFINNKIFIAIAYKRNIFQPSVFHSLLKYTIALEYIQSLHLAIGIVEALNLDLKLWSKS